MHRGVHGQKIVHGQKRVHSTIEKEQAELTTCSVCLTRLWSRVKIGIKSKIQRKLKNIVILSLKRL